MTIFTKKEKLSSHIAQFLDQKQPIGMVPTMGALHQGHISLVAKALEENHLVVVSIFVNPTQFDQAEDLKKYPRTLEQDCALLDKLEGHIVVYAPEVSDLYQKELRTQKFDFDGLEFEMEGRFRDGHFDGVGTVVKKLLEAVKPDNAYFGEKDFQQLQIIKKLVEKEQIPVNIVPCPISREDNGLARSSRNSRLSKQQREEASFIYSCLKTAKLQFGTKSAVEITQWIIEAFEKQPNLELEYFHIADVNRLQATKQIEKNKKYRAFIAVYMDTVRLIDNIALN
ncbi:MAG: pantoate--beta-alanine ligase [Flavobacteriaceae bacterium]|nr:pantoate--beta-alanine ligase [Flavobacteriaceae bacterium]